MSLFRIRIREFAKVQNLKLKDVAERSGVNYNTVKSYARVSAIAMADVVALIKIAKVFGISVEELIEVVEEPPSKNDDLKGGD
jgi:putative transcriptional regulator